VSRRNWILAAVVGLLVVTCAVSASGLAQEPQSDDGGPDTAVDCEPCEWPGRGPEMHFRDRSGLVNVVAEVLGVDTDEVFAALEGGDTLAEFVASHGGDVEDVVDAFVAERQNALDQAVADGRLTEEQAAARVEHMRAQVTSALQGERRTPCLDGDTLRMHRGFRAWGAPSDSAGRAPRGGGPMRSERF